MDHDAIEITLPRRLVADLDKIVQMSAEAGTPTTRAVFIAAAIHQPIHDELFHLENKLDPVTKYS